MERQRCSPGAVRAQSSARPEQCAPGAVLARSGARPKQCSHRAVLARKRQWQCVPAPCELERLPRGAAAGHLGAEGGGCWLVACGLAPCEVAQRMEYIPCGDEGAGRPRGGRALLLRSIACGDSDGAPDELSSCPPQAVVHMHVRWPVCTGDEEKLTLVRLDDSVMIVARSHARGASTRPMRQRECCGSQHFLLDSLAPVQHEKVDHMVHRLNIDCRSDHMVRRTGNGGSTARQDAGYSNFGLTYRNTYATICYVPYLKKSPVAFPHLSCELRRQAKLQAS